MLAEGIEEEEGKEGAMGQGRGDMSLYSPLFVDNAINTKVLVKYLNQMNLNIHTIQNGQEAVELFQKMPLGYFSLILMDCHMPVVCLSCFLFLSFFLLLLFFWTFLPFPSLPFSFNSTVQMDGFQATEEIRRIEMNKVHVPIGISLFCSSILFFF